MKVLSSREAVEKFRSWKRSHTSLKLVMTGREEIAWADVVYVFDASEEWVQLAGSPTGYGFAPDAALITGDDTTLELMIGDARYLLVEARPN